MGQMFDTTRYQINNWRWDNPRVFRDQVDCSNPQTTDLARLKSRSERFPWCCSDDRRAMIEPPSRWRYKQGHLLAVRPLSWYEIIDEDDDDENWPNPRAPSGGRSHPTDDNDNENGEGEEDMQGGEQPTGKGKGTQDGNQNGKATENGKRKEKGMSTGTGQWKGIDKQTPGGVDISRAVALQLRTEMSEADLDSEGRLRQVYCEPEASPAVLMSSDDDTDSTESDTKYDPEYISDVDMRMEDDVDTLGGVDLDNNLDMDRDGADEQKEDEEEEDEEEEEEEEEEDEKEDKEENDGTEPRTIGLGEMVKTSADDADTMVDDQPIVLLEQFQRMGEHTSRPQPPVPAPRRHSPEPRPPPRTLETHLLSGLEHLALVTPQIPGLAVPSLREAEVPGNTSDVDVDQQLPTELAGGDSLPGVPLPELRLDGSVGEESTSAGVAEEEIVVTFRIG